MEPALKSEPEPAAAIWCSLSAIYGIGWGSMMLPTGLFVGPYLIGGALVQIAMGVLYAFAASGICRGRRWASVLAAICGAITTLLEPGASSIL